MTPVLLEQLPRAVVHQVELHRRRAAEAVDEEQRVAFRGRAEIAERSPRRSPRRWRRRGFSLTRRRPGSPWMPTPNSISSSPISKVGLPAAGTVQEVSATPIERVRALTRSPSAFSAVERHAFLGRGADDLLDDQRAGDAAPAGRVERVLDRDVVIGDDASSTPRRPSRPPCRSSSRRLRSS